MKTLLSILFACQCAYSIDLPTGSAARLLRSTALRSEASAISKSVGRLPSSTLVLVKGEEKNGFLPVQIELEDDETVQGWVAVDALTTGREGVDRENIEDARRLAFDEPSGRKLRIRIPKDESVLFGRKPSFYYGLQVGPHYNFMQASDGSAASGFGLEAGGLVGIFVTPEIPVRMELGYAMLSGARDDASAAGTTTSTTTTTKNTSLGFVNTSLVGAYRFDRLEIHLGAQYAYGISVSDIPGPTQATTASEISAYNVIIGGGYYAPIGDVTGLSIQLRYTGSITHGPLSLHQFGLLLGLNLNG